MRGSGNHPANFIIIGRCSQLRVKGGFGLQREPVVRCAVTIARSDEELGPAHWILVGSSSLRRVSSLLLMRLAMVQLKDAWLSAVWEI